MKTIRHTLLLLATILPLFSCVREVLEVPGTGVEDGYEGREVTLYFGVQMPEPKTGTKAMGEQPEISSLHVAVFGSSGYLKEYKRAEPVNGTYVSQEGQAYAQGYKVELSITRSKLRIDFIANGPESLDFDYESNVLSKLTSSGGQDAYWQRVLLDNGIYADTEAEGYYEIPPVLTIDPDFDLDTDGVTHKMALIPLIRNFAKLTVVAEDKSTSNFEVESFCVVNVPDKGTIAAYNPKVEGSFQMNYHTYENLAAMSAVYDGYMPGTATIDKSYPSEEDFTNLTNGVVAAGGALFMYERPVPESDATILIVKGKYTDPKTSEEHVGYYKIDMMQGGDYLPILRNFRYQINIQKVNRKGKTSVAGAINGAGSGDISADISTSSQVNISDGKSAIAVSFTEQTYAIQGTYTIGFSFTPDVATGVVDNSGVSFELLDAGSSGAVIASEDDISIDRSTGTLTFTTTDVDPTYIKSQKIRIVGVSGTSRLYRDVTLRLLPQQQMTVTCISEIEAQAGTAQTVTVSIPKDLPQSIFPLQFKLEVAEKSLTPNASDLPVEPGETIVPGESGRSYQFIKTISYTQYLAGYSGNYSVFTCDFKSIIPVSDSYIYVANDYFAEGSTSFTTYTSRYFSSLKFDTSNAINEDDPVIFSFVMDAEHEEASQKLIPEVVHVYLTGLVADSDNYPDELQRVAGTHYVYTVPEGVAGYATQHLHLLSTGETENYAVSLEAAYYEDEELVNTTAYYTVDTNVGNYGWTSYASAPDGYVGYQSDNYNVASSIATMSVTVVGYTEFTVYIRSNAESTYDYVVARDIGATALTSWTSNTAYDGAKAHTRGNQQSGTTIGSYTAVTFTTADGLTADDTPHTFYIQYGKDNSTNSGDDRGYVLIPDSYSKQAIAVTGVSLDQTSASVARGGTLQLTATLSPSNAENKAVTWTSSDTSVATVSSTGLVTVSSSAAVGSTATITVTTADGGYTATCLVTVRARVWRTGTYTVAMNTQATYNQNSYSDASSGITVTCTNCSGQQDGNGPNKTYYKRIGTTANNGNGTIAISAAGSSLEDCVLTGATITYYNNRYTQTVSASTGTISNNKQTWTASSTGEGNGDSAVTITMNRSGNNNNLNAITQIVISYGYYE